MGDLGLEQRTELGPPRPPWSAASAISTGMKVGIDVPLKLRAAGWLAVAVAMTPASLAARAAPSATTPIASAGNY
jgi:hypothetical protein